MSQEQDNQTPEQIEENLELKPENEVKNDNKSEQDFEAEMVQLKDQLLRALAEAENLRRLKDKQIEDTSKYAVSGFARSLINVMENLERTTDNIPKDQLEGNSILKAISEGVEMTKRELASVFERNGIKRVSPQPGEQFDHNYHQAVVHIPSNEYAPGSVVQVMQAGFIIHDRLLRPAMVGVAKGVEEAINSTEEPK
jgi:molecular chaperone GrpE